MCLIFLGIASIDNLLQVDMGDFWLNLRRLRLHYEFWYTQEKDK